MLAQVMEDAAKLLENNEWGKGQYEVYAGGKRYYCVVGALGKAYANWHNNLSLSYTNALSKIEDHFHNEIAIAMGIKRLVHWNDFVASSKEQVISRLREGAKNMNASK